MSNQPGETGASSSDPKSWGPQPDGCTCPPNPGIGARHPEDDLHFPWNRRCDLNRRP